MSLAQFAREIELLEIRTTGNLARLGLGPMPELGRPIEVSLRVQAGFVRQAEHQLDVSLTVDCRAHRTKGERLFARFVYRGFGRYRAKKAWPNDVLDEFTRTNAMIHLWPYARQAIQTSSAQLGLAPIMLPPFRVTAPVPASE